MHLILHMIFLHLVFIVLNVLSGRFHLLPLPTIEIHISGSCLDPTDFYLGYGDRPLAAIML